MPVAVSNIVVKVLLVEDHFIPNGVDYHPKPDLSSTPDYYIRQFEEGDETEVVRLLEDVFHGWPHHDVKTSSLDFWRWKHRDNPLGRSLVLVTEIDGEIVASNHSCLLRAKVGEAFRLGVVSSDLAVDKRHRRKGVRNSMMTKKHEYLKEMGVEFTLAATGNPIVIESMLRWRRPRFPHPVVVYVRIRDVDLHLEKMPAGDAWVKKTGYKTLSLISKIRSRERFDPSGSISIRRVRRFPATMDEFWGENLDSYDFIVERSSEYLNWRYCDPRAGNYEAYLAEEGDEILGYAVAGVNGIREDYPVGYVAGLVAGGGRGDVSAAILRHAVDRLNEEGINIVLGLAVKGSNVESAYTGSGFIDSRERFELFMTPVGDSRISETVKGFKPERVHYCWGDHDSLPTSVARN